jgi:hypothetical protein
VRIARECDVLVRVFFFFSVRGVASACAVRTSLCHGRAVLLLLLLLLL